MKKAIGEFDLIDLTVGRFLVVVRNEIKEKCYINNEFDLS